MIVNDNQLELLKRDEDISNDPKPSADAAKGKKVQKGHKKGEKIILDFRAPLVPEPVEKEILDDRPVCCHYLQDKCAFPDECRNSHDLKAVVKMCSFGEKCGFGHLDCNLTVAEVRARPNKRLDRPLLVHSKPQATPKPSQPPPPSISKVAQARLEAAQAKGGLLTKTSEPKPSAWASPLQRKSTPEPLPQTPPAAKPPTPPASPQEQKIEAPKTPLPAPPQQPPPPTCVPQPPAESPPPPPPEYFNLAEELGTVSSPFSKEKVQPALDHELPPGWRSFWCESEGAYWFMHTPTCLCSWNWAEVEKILAIPNWEKRVPNPPPLKQGNFSTKQKDLIRKFGQNYQISELKALTLLGKAKWDLDLAIKKFQAEEEDKHGDSGESGAEEGSTQPESLRSGRSPSTPAVPCSVSSFSEGSAEVRDTPL